MAKKSKRLLSILLAVMMLMTMFPITMPVASAADAVSVDTWEELRDALKGETNKVVKLTKDISYEAYNTGYHGVKADIVLDLNGYEIKVKNTYDAAHPDMEDGCYKEFFNIFNGGCLTINDSSKNGDGKISFESYVNSADDFERLPIRDLFVVSDGGTLIVNGGTLQAGTIKKEWKTLFPRYSEGDPMKFTGYVYKLCYGTAVTVKKGGKAIINDGTLIGHGAGSLWDAPKNPAAGKVYDDEGKVYYGAAAKTVNVNAQLVVNGGNFYGYAGADALHLDDTDTLSRVYAGTFTTEGRDDALVRIDSCIVFDIDAGHIGIPLSAYEDRLYKITICKGDYSIWYVDKEYFDKWAWDIDETGGADGEATTVKIIPGTGTERGEADFSVNYHYLNDYYYKDTENKFDFYYNPYGNANSPAVRTDFEITFAPFEYYAENESVEGFSKTWVWKFYEVANNAWTVKYTTYTDTNTINLKDVMKQYDLSTITNLYVDAVYYECYGGQPLAQYMRPSSSPIGIKITDTPLLDIHLKTGGVKVNETYDGSNRVTLQTNPTYEALRSEYLVSAVKTTATYKNSSGVTKTQEFWSTGKFITDSLAEGKTQINYETILYGSGNIQSKVFTQTDYLYILPDMTVSNATKSGEKYIAGSGSMVTLTAPAINGVTNPSISWYKLGANGTYERIATSRTSYNTYSAGTYCYALIPNDGANNSAVYSDPVTIEFQNDYNTITVTPSASIINYFNDTAQEGNITFTVTFGTGFSGGKSDVKHELISWPAGAEAAIKSYSIGYPIDSFTLKQVLPTSAKDVNTIVPGKYVFRTKATNTSTGVTYYSAPVTINVNRYAEGIDIIAEDGTILNADTYFTDNKYNPVYYYAYVGDTLQLGIQSNDGANPFTGTIVNESWTLTDVVGEDVAEISDSGLLTVNKPGRVKVDYSVTRYITKVATKTYTQSAYIDIPVTDFELTMETPTLESDPAATLIYAPEDAPYTAVVKWGDYTVNASTNKFYKNKYPEVYIDLVLKDGYVTDLRPSDETRPLDWYGAFDKSTIKVNGEEVPFDYFDRYYFYDTCYSPNYGASDPSLNMTLKYTYPERLKAEGDVYEDIVTLEIETPSIFDKVDMVISEDSDAFRLNGEIVNPGWIRVMDGSVYKVDFGADADFDQSNDNAVEAKDTDNYEKDQLYRIDFYISRDDAANLGYDVYFGTNTHVFVNGRECMHTGEEGDNIGIIITYYFMPEEYERVNAVDILGVKAPVRDEEVSYDHTIAQKDIYTTYFVWFVDANENGIVDEGEEFTGDYFRAGVKYSLYVELVAEDANGDGIGDTVQFETPVTVKLGDETAEYTMTGDYYGAVYTFPATEIDLVSNIDILGIKTPVTNGKISSDFDIVNDYIEVDRFVWFVDANGSGEPEEGEEVTGDYFEAETEYSLYVSLFPSDEDNDGISDRVSFVDPVTIKIGDETADLIMTGDYNGAVYTFPTTEAYEELTYNDDHTSIKTYVGQYVERSIYENVSGGVLPYTFTKVSGPDWLSIDSVTGVISGTPTKVSDYDYLTFTVTDASGASVEFAFYIWGVNILPADREVITSVTATTDIEDILVYGAPYKDITYTMGEGCEEVDFLYRDPYSWEIKVGDEWQDFDGDYFLDGTYRIVTQVRVDDDAGATHMFDENEVLPVTVDGVDWNTEDNMPSVYDTYSFMWVQSPEFTIEKPENTVVDKIEITGVTAPTVGDVIEECRPEVYTLPEGALYTVTDTEWLCGLSTAPAEGQVFVEDYSLGYSATFELLVAPGYEFASEEDITVTINGQPADMVFIWSDGTATVRLLMEPKAHVKGEPVIENVIDGTCTETGYYDEVYYCIECGEELERINRPSGALGHTWDEENGVVTPPTCTDDGYTTYTCTICGETEDHDYVDALGHTAGEPVITDEVPPTCTEEGYYTTTHYCTVCGEVITSYGTAVDPLGHTAGEPVITDENPATCTTPGSYQTVTYCTECGAVVSTGGETIEALGHTLDEENGVVTPPTCTDEGYTTYTCKVCGETEDRDYVEALDHTPAAAVKENEVPATETTPGSFDSVVYCSVCTAEISRTEMTIPVIGSGTTVGGNYTSYGSDTDEIAIALFAEGEGTALQAVAKTGNTGTYSFENVADGTYTIVVTKNNHVTRFYTVVVTDGTAVTQDLKIHLIGDINGDGKANTIDVARANSHAKSVTYLTGYELDCANVNGDAKVNTIDVARINSHAKSVTLLW